MQQDTLTVRPSRPGLLDVTEQIAGVVAAAGVRTGMCNVFVQHTSASLLIQENADPDVLRDLEDWFARVAPEGAGYRHHAEGPDDMPAHIRGAITAASLNIPLTDGRLALGTWQAIYLFEHRTRARPRTLVITVW